MDDLVNLEMSRLEFLKLLGVSVASIFGFGFLMSMASRMRSSTQTAPQTNSDHGFGSRKFGE
jgi:hypothetical protein